MLLPDDVARLRGRRRSASGASRPGCGRRRIGGEEIGHRRV
jgi:hypothetical protein